MPKKKAYYILVGSASVPGVMEEHYFESLGGLTALWGKSWEKIYADDLADAHRVANDIQSERCVNA